MSSAQPRERERAHEHEHEHDPEGALRQTKPQRALELGIFLLASLIGIYGLGKGLVGFYERGQEINLLWLAVTGVAFLMLAAQMGRVHDTWPRRPKHPASRAAVPDAGAERAQQERK